jgi:hypothetical protein
MVAAAGPLIRLLSVMARIGLYDSNFADAKCLFEEEL